MPRPVAPASLDTADRGSRSWDLAALEELGAEIGVSPAAIQAAWVETAAAGQQLPYAEHLDDQDATNLSRALPGSSTEVLAAIRRWFLQAGFEEARHSTTSALFLRKTKNKRLPGIRQVIVDVHQVPSAKPTTVIRLTLGRSRPGRKRFRSEATEAMQGWSLLTGAVVLITEPVGLEHGLMALPVIAVVSGVQGLFQSRSKRRRFDTASGLEVEGLLDLLEHRGPDAIEPAKKPPPKPLT
ncbi:MAG: hypothetical protein ACR2H3_12295 [Acidimicrobiales bacterium]